MSYIPSMPMNGTEREMWGIRQFDEDDNGSWVVDVNSSPLEYQRKVDAQAEVARRHYDGERRCFARPFDPFEGLAS